MRRRPLQNIGAIETIDDVKLALQDIVKILNNINQGSNDQNTTLDSHTESITTITTDLSNYLLLSDFILDFDQGDSTDVSLWSNVSYDEGTSVP